MPKDCKSMLVVIRGEYEQAKDGYPIGTVFALEGMVTLLISTGKPEKAARLIGCADGVHEKNPDVRPAIEEADMYGNLASIPSRVGPSGLEVTCYEVRSMTPDAAVAYALKQD